MSVGGILIGKSPRWGALIALVGVGLFTAEAFHSVQIAGQAVTAGASFTPIWFVGVAILVGMLFIGDAVVRKA